MMTRAMTSVCLSLAFLLAVGACQKVGSGETFKTVEPPGTLLATIELPSPENLGSLPAFADRFQPGVGAMMGGPLMSSAIAQLFEGASLMGADMDKPALLLINGVDGPESMVLVVGVKDAGKLRESLSGGHVDVRGKYAAIGKEKTVKELADYGIFRAQTLTVKDVGGTVYPRPLLDASGKVLEGLKAAMLQSNNAPAMQTIVDLYAKFFSALGKQTKEVNFRLYARGGTATLDFVLVPHPDTPLAGMIALQKPSDFALLGRLRGDAKHMIVMAGSMLLGPARKPLLDGMRPIMEAMYSQEAVASWWTVVEPMFDMFTGDMAMLMSFGNGGMQVSSAMGLTKGREFRKLLLPLLKTLGKQGQINTFNFNNGPKQEISFMPNVFTYGGVEVDQQVTTTDYSTIAPEVASALKQQGLMLPRMETHFAALDDLYVTEIGTSPTEATKAAIDTALGKKAGFQPSGALTTALDGARNRKDNVVMIFDLKDFFRALAVPANTTLPSSFAMAVGFPDDQMRMSFSLSM